MKKILLAITLFIFYLIPVYADSITISCPKEVSDNSDIACTLTGNSNAKITSVKIEISSSSNISYYGFTKANNWNGDGNDSLVTLYTDEPVTGGFSIGTIKLKYTGPNPGNVSLRSVTYFDEEDNTIEVPAVSADVKLKKETTNDKPAPSTSTNNQNSNKPGTNETKTNDNKEPEETAIEELTVSVLLDDLKVENYVLDFRTNNYDYTLTINDEEKLNITPVLNDENAKYTITGNNNLKNGSVIKVIITNDDGDESIYRIAIMKEEKVNATPIFIGAIIALVIINILRLILGRKKKLKDNISEN